MSGLPSLDLHAHVDPAISARDLLDLGAVVFAVTRSLDEAEAVLERKDERTAWGVGCHPGLVGAHTAFNADRFARLIERTAFVSEVGLDGKSRVPMATQKATLEAVLSTLQQSPRVTSLHSFEASDEILEALESRPIKGAVLHWWLGGVAQTRRAVALGCFFSINASSVRRSDLLDAIPLTRVLTETDHPFGDRCGDGHPRPGGVADVERSLARHYGVTASELREAVWANLGQLAGEARCVGLMPHGVRVRLAAT